MTVEDLKNLLKGELTDEIVNYIKSENPFPNSVIQWLSELILLRQVPFNNLIVDEKILPNESLRLFYLDKNWTNALLDGALSIGIHSERDILLQQAMNNIIRAETNKKVIDDAVVQLGTVAGLIIRSSIVSNYKSLEINGFDASHKPINTLRFERLSANVLFVLFDTVPTRVAIKAPSERQILAIVINEISTRQITNEVGKPTNKTIKLNHTHFRNESKRVLNIAALQQTIAEQLGKNELTPSEFGIQLINSPKVFELVNEDIDLALTNQTENEVKVNKQLIFNKLFK